jgi:hypothetical protein
MTAHAVHTSASIVVDPFVFRRGDWGAEMTEGGMRVSPVPGTWHPPIPGAPGFGQWRALVCCPGCAAVTGLHRRITHVSPEGKLDPDLRCMACAFHRVCYLDRWNRDKPLYCAAIDRNGKLEKRYTHADSQAQALRTFAPAIAGGRLIACAPAVGFYVTDAKGDRLSAD